MTDQINAGVKHLFFNSFIIMKGKSDIRNHTKKVVLVLLIHMKSILIVCRKKNLWTRALADLTLLLVQCFREELPCLHQDKLVKFRQICRIIPD